MVKPRGLNSGSTGDEMFLASRMPSGHGFLATTKHPQPDGMRFAKNLPKDDFAMRLVGGATRLP